jgi:uncharacterized protein (DUF885 family)
MRTLCCTLTLLCAVIQAPANAALKADAGFGRTAVADCGTDLSLLNQVTGWQTSWPAEWTRIAAAPDATKEQEAALARWREAPKALDAAVVALKEGVKSGQTAPRAVAARVLQQASDLRARLADPASQYFSSDGGAFDSDWRNLMIEEIAPALDRYVAFLRETYIPQTSDRSALATLKDGGKCFAGATKFWTTLSLDPDQVEATGERVFADIRGELVALSETDESLDQILARLRRTHETAPITSDALIDLSAAALKRAEAELPKWFAEVPATSVVVTPMADHMQASFPAGFYQPAEDGGDAAYVINPSRPAERRLLAEAIAFHEGVPGHHLFFAYPRRSDEGAFNSGLAEGWAIYAEHLADEMGVYATRLDREGMHAKHLWSASRLVIEPRLHSGKWSRKDAIKYMARVTALPIKEIEIEIDRTLAMPGQSLSYTLGADVILRARERARAALGDRFDIKAFHAVVVGPGLRPLSKVEAEVDAWVAEMSKTPL